MNAKISLTVSVIVATIAGLAVYFVAFRPVGEVAQSPSPSPTPDETASWQTYRNENSTKPLPGQQISYPLDWTTKSYTAYFEGADYGDNVLVISKGLYSIEIVAPAGTEGASCVFEGNFDPTAPFQLDLRGKQYTAIKSPATTYRRFEDTGPDEEGVVFRLCSETEPEYQIRGGDKFLLEFMTYKVPKNYDSNVLLQMDDIVKTIRPIEVSTDISSWLTYRNEEYGFEVKYPEKYNLEGRDIPLTVAEGQRGNDFIVTVQALSDEDGAMYTPTIVLITESKVDVSKFISDLKKEGSGNTDVQAESITLQGVTGTHISWRTEIGTGESEVIITKNNYTFSIHYWNGNDQILSTFRFFK